MEEMHCASCGRALKGYYCHHCGEKRLQRSDYTISHFFKHIFEGMTNLNGNFFSTCRLLYTKPGTLTSEYMAGRRKNYLKPVQVFLIANVFYFLLASFGIVQTFNTPLQSHLSSGNFWHKELAGEMVSEEIESRETSFSDYSALFNRVADTQSKTLIFIMVPPFAFALHILVRRKSEFFIRSLVFSSHFFAYTLTAVIVAIVFLSILINIWHAIFGLSFLESISVFWNSLSGMRTRFYLSNESVLTFTAFMLLLFYLFAALRRAFNQGKISAALKAFLLTLTFYYILIAYRAILFFVAFFTT